MVEPAGVYMAHRKRPDRRQVDALHASRPHIDLACIEIRGFGSWFVKQYKSYVGRNPKTGADVFVPEKKLPFFKVGKELKKRIDS